MQVIEHQYLHYQNVLACKVQLDSGCVTDFLMKLSDNLSVLNLKQTGKAIFTVVDSFVEFNIPVDTVFQDNSHFQYKPEFKLVNAVRARHYGSFDDIEKRVMELNQYIENASLNSVTQPYFIARDVANGVYDILIGIDENVL